MTIVTAEAPPAPAIGAEPRVRSAVPVLRTVLATLATAVAVFLLATFATFALGAASGSNPAAVALGEVATQADVDRLNHQFGLDRPFLVRYLDWIAGAVTGQLGTSWFTGIPVADSIAQAFPVSLSIAAGATIIALVGGFAGGVLAAVTRGGVVDRLITLLSTVAATVPAFVAAIGLILLFAYAIPLFPVAGYTPPDKGVGAWLLCLVLPSAALSLDAGADIARQLRTSLVGTLGENFIVGARVHGLGPARIVVRHALPIASGPALSTLGVHAPRLVGGAVITEVIFGMPGLGQLANRSALQGDVPVVQGVLLVTIAVIVAVGAVLNVVISRAGGTERSAA
ncbi:ABC transporter permease [Microbacterium sp. XT11]|uniref:ABC transporter permease n=1 Tax=Microbacterium sp. XT11 TaxID=367477 RepID=UPI000742F858|nr:ABC transporter permease [Microbacterium sp. XT11]ALX67362.1 binding-protein-dependent transport systems inner membrane component [Microbacterium sp. XT11]